jgi:hypothetical protein
MNFLRILSRDREQPKSQIDMIKKIDDDVSSMITRGRFMGEKLAFGPNFVHTYIRRANGHIEDLGWNHNLKTTVGMDWLHQIMGGGPTGYGVSATVATASSATSLTATGTPWTSNQYRGAIVVAENSTNSPVWANIGSNTTSVLTVDSWKYGDDTAGATPGSTANFIILPGQGSARYIGLTTDTGGPATGDTTLTSEITTNGLGRALATFAHTPGATTFTLAKTFTASGTHTAVHKAGLFTAENSTAAGILVAATNLNADATLASGDSIAVTWTWTLPAAG